MLGAWKWGRDTGGLEGAFLAFCVSSTYVGLTRGSMAGVFKNIITFGAAGRVDDEKDKLNAQISEFHALERKVNEHKEEMDSAIEDLVNAKVGAVETLKKIRHITENISIKDRKLAESNFAEGENIELRSLDVAHSTLTASEAAINAAKGLSTGASTALGAWALVTTFGTASTGTAIASLSGAAATNAALAVLGGGTLAAGGGGVAAGTAVLGGLVAIPAIIGLAAFSHLSASRKIKEIRTRSVEVVEACEQYQKALLVIELATRRAEELSMATKVAEKAFSQEIERAMKKLFPFGVLSRIFRKIRKLFGGRYYSEADLREISYVGQIASRLARIIDIKVFESDGSVAKGKIE